MLVSGYIRINKTHFLLFRGLSSCGKDRLISHHSRDDKSYGNTYRNEGAINSALESQKSYKKITSELDLEYVRSLSGGQIGWVHSRVSVGI